MIAALKPNWNKGPIPPDKAGPVNRELTQDTVFPLRLERTYYNKGFFNVRRAFDHLVRSDDGPITLQLRDDGSIEGRVDRRANNNGTARVMGGARLRDWFQRNYAVGATVPVRFATPSRLVIG